MGLSSFCSLRRRKAGGEGTERARRACGNFEEAIRGRNKMDQQQPVPGQVQIKADEKELQGQYSNLVMIHHNLEEFTLNFIYIFPNGAQGKLLNSVIVSPGHAKRIWRALGENLGRYEAQFGPIKESPEGSGPTPNVGFVQ
jgi:hypothetical protein